MKMTGSKKNMLKFLRFYSDDDYSRFDKWFLSIQIVCHKHMFRFEENLNRFNLKIESE